MLANAFRELRLHPGRFAAVLTAIALSIGFLSAVQVFVRTESGAAGKREVIHTTRADVVVGATSRDRAAVGQVVADTPDLTDVDEVQMGTGSVSHDGRTALVRVWTVPTHESLRWMKPSAGALPAAADQIMLSTRTAAGMGAQVGDRIKISLAEEPVEFTVAGLADEPGLYLLPAYLTAEGMTRALGGADTAVEWVARTATPGDAERVVADLDSRLRALAPASGYEVQTGAQAQAEAVRNMAGDFDVMQNMLLVFGAIAVLVGMIIIANTFAILVAQRRRQTGLLRAVGASRGQVLRRYVAEAVVLGAVGSVLGIGLGVLLALVPLTFLTGSIRFGLSVPWGGLATTLLAGILVTVIASLLPLRKALQVAPLEALRPVESAESARKASLVRLVLTGLLTAAGVAVALWSLRLPSNQLVVAIVGSFLITFGVLGAAPLYVPLLLRVLGRLVGGSPTARLAATNAARNPGRAGATATALMLAVGLIVTLGVASATLKSTMNTQLDEKYPLEMVVSPGFGGPRGPAAMELPEDLAGKVAAVDGVRAAVGAKAVREVAQVGDSGLTSSGRPIVAWSPSLSAALPGGLTVGADELVVHPDDLKDHPLKDGDRVQVRFAPWSVGGPEPAAPSEPVTLTLRTSSAAGELWYLGSRFDQLFPDARTAVVVGAVKDRQATGQTMADVQKVVRDAAPQAMLSGSLFLKAVIGQALDMLLLVTTGLLGVAALIALIGVGNTLSLSVLERTRESALLRALGLQRGSLRWMLMIEALLLALVGTLVGIAAGFFFGWLGAAAVMKEAKIDGLVFAVNPLQLVVVVLVAGVAAVLASILPGRKAARATPVEALADVG